jgi:hypothetical protein
MDLAGNIFVADQGNHRIRVILKNGSVLTYAGTANSIIPNLDFDPYCLTQTLGFIIVSSPGRILKIKNIYDIATVTSSFPPKSPIITPPSTSIKILTTSQFKSVSVTSLKTDQLFSLPKSQSNSLTMTSSLPAFTTNKVSKSQSDSLSVSSLLPAYTTNKVSKSQSDSLSMSSLLPAYTTNKVSKSQSDSLSMSSLLPAYTTNRLSKSQSDSLSMSSLLPAYTTNKVSKSQSDSFTIPKTISLVVLPALIDHPNHISNIEGTRTLIPKEITTVSFTTQSTSVVTSYSTLEPYITETVPLATQSTSTPESTAEASAGIIKYANVFAESLIFFSVVPKKNQPTGISIMGATGIEIYYLFLLVSAYYMKWRTPFYKSTILAFTFLILNASGYAFFMVYNLDRTIKISDSFAAALTLSVMTFTGLTQLSIISMLCTRIREITKVISSNQESSENC